MSNKKSRSFSVYLLKEGFFADNALKGLSLKESKANNLPPEASIYILENHPKEPWWKDYWDVQENLEQVLKGAIVFLPINKRCFAITYGHAYHQLKDNSYEYDFGIRTSLNALDPNKIKSTDTLVPESSKRERVQSPLSTSWNFFDFKNYESIVKRLHGNVLEQYSDLFKNVTGSTNLKFTSKCQPNELKDLCFKLLTIYEKEDYKTNFPDLQLIVPLKDPDTISQLNDELIKAFKQKSKDLYLAIPDIVDTNKQIEYFYRGLRQSQNNYDEVYIDHYRDYLSEKNFDTNNLTMKDLNNHELVLKADDGQLLGKHSIFKSLIFECKVDGESYHLCEGEWYSIDRNYVTKLKNELDPIFQVNKLLPKCNDKREDNYNSNTAIAKSWECLDKKNISLPKQTQVEPCDLIYDDNGVANFVHVKISTRSASLSHLFNQGINSIELIRSEQQSMDKLISLISNNNLKQSLENGQFKITYGIITNKPDSLKSDALPIFSRISLMRAYSSAKQLGVECEVVLIKDEVDRR